MRKHALWAAAGLLSLACLSDRADARDLTVVSWGGPYQDALREIYWKPFTAETGIKVAEDTWDGGLGVMRTKVQGGNSTWDVVLVEADEVAIGCDEGLYEDIDPIKVGGAKRYLEGAVSPCGIGALIWNILMVYDGDKLKTPPNGWADFFDTRKYPGKRALRNNAKWNLEIALMADGVPPADVYKVLRTPEGVDRAFRKLDMIKSDLLFWKAGGQPIQMLGSGDVVFTTAYSARVTNANKNDKRNFKVVWKDAVYTMDSWVIVKGSPHKAAAEKLIEFMGRPENQAKMTIHAPYGTTAVGASDLISKDVLNELPTHPDHLKVAFREDVTFWIDNNDKLAERWASWTGSK